MKHHEHKTRHGSVAVFVALESVRQDELVVEHPLCSTAI